MWEMNRRRVEWRFTASFKDSCQVYVPAFGTYVPCLMFLIRPADQNEIKVCVCAYTTYQVQNILLATFWGPFFCFLCHSGFTSWGFSCSSDACAASACFRFHWSASSFIYVCLPCSSTPELLIAFIVKRNEGCFYHHLLAGQRWEWRQMGRVYDCEQSLLKFRDSLCFAAAGDNPEICYQCKGSQSPYHILAGMLVTLVFLGLDPHRLKDVGWQQMEEMLSERFSFEGALGAVSGPKPAK